MQLSGWLGSSNNRGTRLTRKKTVIWNIKIDTIIISEYFLLSNPKGQPRPKTDILEYRLILYDANGNIIGYESSKMKNLQYVFDVTNYTYEVNELNN